MPADEGIAVEFGVTAGTATGNDAVVCTGSGSGSGVAAAGVGAGVGAGAGGGVRAGVGGGVGVSVGAVLGSGDAAAVRTLWNLASNLHSTYRKIGHRTAK